MKSIFGFLLLFAFIFQLHAEEDSVLITVAPYVQIVDLLTEKTIRSDLVVPPGASFHDYEPTPKQILQAQKAKVWFGIGEPFEKKVSAFLQKHNPEFVFVDLRDGVELLSSACGHGHQHHDPHMWLSPKILQHQTQVIGETLIEVFPEKKDIIEKNLPKVLRKLQDLDTQLHKLFANKKDLVVLVAHPAYAYFCHEYGIQQISIEYEGKEPSAKQLTDLIKKARELHIHTVFTQGQYPGKGALLVANEIGAEVIALNPYSQDYFNAMLEIGTQFAKEGVHDSH